MRLKEQHQITLAWLAVLTGAAAIVFGIIGTIKFNISHLH